MRPSKRKFRSSLEFVEAGFRACLQNAQDLVSASQKLIAAELHAPALSVAVLALEELGKLFALDGLL
jgi:AbiV family abortive infection protein